MTRHKPEKDYGTQLKEVQKNEAWKYVGYPRFSRFMASSTDCFAVRKFCHLNVRVLLKLQDDIVKLERKLMEMDLHSMNMAKGKGGCGSFRLDADTPRERLLNVIAEKTKDYNERLNQFLQLQDRPTSSLDQSRNLRNWLSNYPNAIEEAEQEFIDREEDLVVVRTAQRTQFGRWMEWIGLSRIARPSGLMTGGPTRYYDRGIWKSIGAFCILAIMLGMLLGPMWSLSVIVASTKRLTLVTAFALSFSLFVVIGTTLKGFQRLVLIAGYFVQLILVFGLVPVRTDGVTATDLVSPPPTSTAIVYATSIASSPTTHFTLASTSTIGPTPSAEMSPETNDSYKQLPISAGAIAGIVIGILTMALLAASFLWLLWRRRRCRATFRGNTPEVLETGKTASMKQARAVQSSTNSSCPPAKIRQKWLGVGSVRQETMEAMDSQILEMPEPSSPSELEGRISSVRQISNVLPASVERRTTASRGDAIGPSGHGRELKSDSSVRDSPIRESPESEERAHLVSSARRSTGKAHRKLGTLRIDTSTRSHIFDEKG